VAGVTRSHRRQRDPKDRPCLIISPLEMHDYLRTVIVAPMTTKTRQAPYRIAVTFQGKHGFVLLDQIRTLDKSRLIRKLGGISSATLTRPSRRCSKSSREPSPFDRRRRRTRPNLRDHHPTQDEHRTQQHFAP